MSKHIKVDITDTSNAVVSLINDNIHSIVKNYSEDYRYVLNSVYYDEEVSNTITCLEGMESTGTRVITDGVFVRTFDENGSKRIDFNNDSMHKFTLITYATSNDMFDDAIVVDVMLQGDLKELKDYIDK